MRRKDRNLSKSEAYEIVDNCVYATISCLDENGEIFSLPLSIVREDDLIFIHGAKVGAKARLFKDNKECTIVCVSFASVPKLDKKQLESIADDERELGNRAFTTEYKSAIATTNARLVGDDETKIRALRALCQKYTPHYMSAFEVAAHGALNITNIYEFKIKSITAKAKILS